MVEKEIEQHNAQLISRREMVDAIAVARTSTSSGD